MTADATDRTAFGHDECESAIVGLGARLFARFGEPCEGWPDWPAVIRAHLSAEVRATQLADYLATHEGQNFAAARRRALEINREADRKRVERERLH